MRHLSCRFTAGWVSLIATTVARLLAQALVARANDTKEESWQIINEVSRDLLEDIILLSHNVLLLSKNCVKISN